MFNLEAVIRSGFRTLSAVFIAISCSGVAHPAAFVLNATQNKAVHSFDGRGCQDFDSQQRKGRLRSGSCVEFQIKIQNKNRKTPASAINFKNPMDKGLIFIAALADGFSGGTLDIPKMNTDCALGLCLIIIQDASIEPEATGTLLIRAVVK